LQIAEIPVELSKYYPPDYYSYNIPVWLSGSENLFSSFLKGIRNNYAIRKRGFIGKWLYSKYPAKGLEKELLQHFPGHPEDLYEKESRILDIGCGNGRFLHVLRTVGFKNVMGIDPYCEKDILYANGLRILKKSIRNITGEFDLVMLHHSFEHMPNPLETLRDVSRLLSKNGYCVIRIPIVDSYAWRHYRENWMGLDAPRHLFLHSLKSIKVLVDKVELKIVKIVYDSSEYTLWASEQYKKDIPLESEKSYLKDKYKSIFSTEDIEMFKKQAKELNRRSEGDTVAIYLHKS